MPDYLRRALRTFFQALLGSLLTSGVLSAASTDGVVDWSAAQKAAVAALAAGIIAAFTLAQNVLEDHTTMPALLKAPASEGENPVPEPPPAPAKPVRKPRKRVVRDDGQSLVYVLLVVILIVLLVRLL